MNPDHLWGHFREHLLPWTPLWDVSWELSWGVLEGLKIGKINSRGCSHGGFRSWAHECHCAAKGGDAQKIGDCFFGCGHLLVTVLSFSGVFGHFFAYPLLPPPFCGRVRVALGPLVGQILLSPALRVAQLWRVGGGCPILAVIVAP